MQLSEVQTILRELEDEKYEIYKFLIRTLRIARHRLDISEVLFLELHKIKLTEENIAVVYNEIETLALSKGISKEDYKSLSQDVCRRVLNLKSCDWYDFETQKISKNKALIFSVSEIINRLEHFSTLLEKNVVPNGLAALDLYYANEKKKKLDAIYNLEISNLKTILNRIRDYIIDYLIQIENELIHIKESVILSTQDILQKLITDGDKVKNANYVESEFGDYITGTDYVEWIHRCKMFVKQNVRDKEFITKFSEVADKANGNDERYFIEMIGMLRALIGYSFSDILTNPEDNTIEKIFISHSSKDIEYVETLVELLNDIGVKKSQKSIFCSSLPGYDIPHGESIYEFLKNELNTNHIMVLFVLSDNYYESAPCLNEMGATWITSKAYTTILTPNFDFKQITGAIDPTKISFKMNDKSGLNKFRDKINQTLELEEIDYKIWEKDREKFLSKIKKISVSEASTLNTRIELEKVKKHTDNQLEIQLRFINVTEKDIEFQYIDCELIDESGNKLNISVEDEHLDNFILINKENKVVKWIVPYDVSSNYKPRRNVSKDAKITFAIL